MITKRLLDVCDFQGGTQPPKEEWINDPRDGYVRMLQIRDYSQGDAKFIQYVKDTKKLHKCKKDDIMLSRYGYIGQAFMGLEGAYNVALVKVIKKEEIHTPYLLYYFQSYYFQHFLLSNVGARATIPGFNKDELENALIRIPEMKEQVEIASKIAKVDELIGFHKQQLDILDTLIKSRFIEMFGDSEHNTMNWPTAKLSTLCDVGSSKRIYQSELTENGIPFLRISDLNERIDGEYNEPQLFIPNKRFDELKTNGLVPSAGDILVTARGTLGRCYIVKTEDEFYFQDGMISWLSDISENITSLYISELFATAGVQKQIANLQAGSTVAYLSIAMLKKLDIMMPPKALQQQFATFVEQIDKSKYYCVLTLKIIEKLLAEVKL